MWIIPMRLAFAVGCAIALLAGPARGQTPTDRMAARRLAGQAMDLYKAGDYGTALERFERANELVPAPSLAIRIARCLDQLDRMLEAAEVYRGVIAAEIKPSDPAPYHQARKEAVPELAALLEQIPSVVIAVEGEGAAQAEVSLEGAPLPRAMIGERQEIDPGHYVFEARVGSRSVREEVRLERGKKMRIVLVLPPAPIDEAPPAAPVESADPAPWRFGGYTALGIGGAAVVVGVAAGLVVLAQHGDLEKRCPDGGCFPEDHDDARAFNQLRDASTAMLIIGGVGVATGAALLIFAPEDPEAALHLRPVVGLGMLGVEGRFR